MLVVDLVVVYVDLKRRVLGFDHPIDLAEDLGYCSRNDAVKLLDIMGYDFVLLLCSAGNYLNHGVWTQHSKRFTRPGLSIGKNSAIEPFKKLHNCIFSYRIISFKLRRVRVQNSIKREI